MRSGETVVPALRGGGVGRSRIRVGTTSVGGVAIVGVLC